MTGRLDGKVALITGGARGQGAAEAQLFSDEGAAVVITDVLDRDGRQTASAIDNCSYQHLDVTNEGEWQAVVHDIVESHNKIDVLINNAGIYTSRPMTELSVDEYRRVIEVNQVGVFLGMKTIAAPMTAAGAGSIINLSSIAGLRGGPGVIAYAASKWAVRGMTKVAARELGPFGIRVNSIHPGLIDTAMLQQVPDVEAGRLDRWIRQIPLGRVAEAVEVARLALFLASDDSAYSSGSEFLIDGGMTA